VCLVFHPTYTNTKSAIYAARLCFCRSWTIFLMSFQCSLSAAVAYSRCARITGLADTLAMCTFPGLSHYPVYERLGNYVVIETADGQTYKPHFLQIKKQVTVNGV